MGKRKDIRDDPVLNLGARICSAGDLVAAEFGATGRWLTPAEAYVEARDLLDVIRDAAATAPLKAHKLRGDVAVIEGSGGNIAVLTGPDGKVFIDAGITATRPRIMDAVSRLGRDPIKHLINTHWDFDHTDGNQWLNAEGAAILAHENTHKHLLSAQRVATLRQSPTRRSSSPATTCRIRQVR
jgi:hypothetical protein